MSKRIKLSIYALNIIFVLHLFIVFYVNNFRIYAQNIISDESILKVDRNISKKTRNYSQPREIVVVPIQSLNISKQEIETKDWFRGIYYYTIQRLGFEDIPFHYIVTSEGEIYKGIDDIIDRKINFGEYNENSIILGYLNNSSLNNISKEGESALKEILLSLCNENNINPQSILISEFRINKNKETNVVSIETFLSQNNPWIKFIEKIKNEIKNSFSPKERKYKVQILGIEYPKDLFDQATEEELIIKIKNTGEYGIYPDSESSLYLTRENSRFSNFYLASAWATFNQIELQKTSDQILLPQEEISFPFKIRIPLYKGEYSENFTIKNSINKNIESNTINIKLNIKDSGKQIIAIRPVPDGILNIRSGPGINFPVVTTVTQGSRFYFIEQNSVGWVHIDLLDGRSGWTAFWNIEYIN